MVYYIQRDSLGDGVSNAGAERFRAALARAIGHAVEWGDSTGCQCPQREAHLYIARWLYDEGEWYE